MWHDFQIVAHQLRRCQP